MEPGVTAPVTAPGADIRTDVPLYRVWKRGELVAEVPIFASIGDPIWSRL